MEDLLPLWTELNYWVIQVIACLIVLGMAHCCWVVTRNGYVTGISALSFTAFFFVLYFLPWWVVGIVFGLNISYAILDYKKSNPAPGG